MKKKLRYTYLFAYRDKKKMYLPSLVLSFFIKACLIHKQIKGWLWSSLTMFGYNDNKKM